MIDVAEVSSFWIDREILCIRRSHAGSEDESRQADAKIVRRPSLPGGESGRLVTHDELLEALWPGVHVQPEVLKSHILSIRTALGDTISSPRFIETQRGRGYRFIGRMRTGPLSGRKARPGCRSGRVRGPRRAFAEPLRAARACGCKRAPGGLHQR